MGKLIGLTDFQKERVRLYNLGFKDAYEDTGCNLELYENNEPYRRGYDAGEDVREVDLSADPSEYWMTPEEIKAVYGDPKDWPHPKEEG
jgi:hypothetical protein